MGDGEIQSLPSTSVCRPSILSVAKSIPGVGCFCLFWIVLTLNGCYSGQEKQIATGRNMEKAVAGQQADSSDQGCSYFYFLWGRNAELEDSYGEAKEAYEKALICDPDQQYIRKRLVGILIQMGEEQEALASLQEMTDGDGDDTESLFMLARLYARMDSYRKAEEMYQRILDIDPENQRALLFLGTLHAQNENFKEGSKILERLVEINEQSFMGYNYLAKLYRELNLPYKAAAAYEKALEISWSGELAWEAVRFYERNGMYQEAADIYERFLEEDSANLKLRGRLVKLYLHMNRVDKAMEALQDMKPYMADTLQLDITIGRFLLEQRRYKEAVNHFRQMLEEGGQPGAVSGFLALAYHGVGEDAKAKEVLQAIPESSEAYEDAVLMLIRIYQDEEKQDRAISLLEDAIAGEESRRPPFYAILAELYYEQGEKEAGIRIYEEGINHYPDNVEIRYNFAIFLDRMGRMDEALERMKEVLTIAPDDPQALNYVGYTWADQGVKLDEALDYIQKAVAARPESGFILDSLGWVYYRRGDYSKAVAELEKAVALEPDDPTINEHLGDAYVKAGKFEEAASVYRKALEIYQEEEKKAGVRDKLENLNRP